MDAPPLTLSVLHLRPSTLLIPGDEPPPPASPLPSTPIPPSHPLPLFSPTHAYPAPHPSCTLGSTLALSLDLANTSASPVQGVRMMCEVQSPGGRFRLGEAIHGLAEGEEEGIDTPLKELAPGESVRLEVEGEVKDLGVGVVIVSAAWETPDGRRTLQRFFKYNVNPPLAIKTRIQQAQHPNTALDLDLRENIYLEILASNVSQEGMVFDRVFLEPVNGLTLSLTSLKQRAEGSERLESPHTSTETTTADSPVATHGTHEDGEKRTLLPGETRQYLFLLSPSPPESAKPNHKESTEGTSDTPAQPAVQPGKRSSFPPNHTPGMILPLGRLDLTWRAGPSHDPGRLQTSTLNRRIPVTAPSGPSRTLSTQSGVSHTGSSMRTPGTGVWEFDLAVMERPENVGVETDFEVILRVGVRTADIVEEGEEGAPIMPTPPVIGIQYLAQPLGRGVPSERRTLAVSGPERGNTPAPTTMARTSSAMSAPFSSSHAQTPSRAMTPVSSQLRQATSSHLTAPNPTQLASTQFASGGMSGVNNDAQTSSTARFPPAPVASLRPLPPKAGDLRGEAQYLGPSLSVIPVDTLDLVEERSDTTYADPISPLRRWETTFEHKLRFMAMDEGLAELGALRLLVLDDERGLGGSAGREWDSLGEIWVSG